MSASLHCMSSSHRQLYHNPHSIQNKIVKNNVNEKNIYILFSVHNAKNMIQSIIHSIRQNSQVTGKKKVFSNIKFMFNVLKCPPIFIETWLLSL